MKPSTITALTAIFACMFCSAIFGQTNTSAVTTAAPQPAEKTVQVSGLVIAQGKYSIKIQSDDKEYIVKLANGAPVALKMNKPWFDWKNERIVVDELPYPATGEETKTPKRLAIDLPAKELFVISRFSDRNLFDEYMAASVKRVNFYLVTPENQGNHMPTEKEPYLAGKLDYSNASDVRLNIEGKTFPVKLGFRLATMNGFSSSDLVANKTQVFLTGIEGDRENVVIASRILFQPVHIEE